MTRSLSQQTFQYDSDGIEKHLPLVMKDGHKTSAKRDRLISSPIHARGRSCPPSRWPSFVAHCIASRKRPFLEIHHELSSIAAPSPHGQAYGCVSLHLRKLAWSETSDANCGNRKSSQIHREFQQNKSTNLKLETHLEVIK